MFNEAKQIAQQLTKKPSRRDLSNQGGANLKEKRNVELEGILLRENKELYN